MSWFRPIGLHTIVCARSCTRAPSRLLGAVRGPLLLGALLLAAPAVRTQDASAAGTAGEESPRATIALDEIERGMTGWGVSVFSGTEAQRFEVEVVGKLENLEPGLSFIMAELSGQGLEDTGVVAGMSGSPVYLDDRLAGAVAFSWNFSQGALAGITPIAAMRDLAALPARATGSAIPSPRSFEVRDPRLAALLEGDFSALLERGRTREDLRAWLSAVAPASRVTRGEGSATALQLTSVGFGPEARALMEHGLADAVGWTGMGAAAGGRVDEARALPPLSSGGPVAALLVGGDLQMAVNGTITERRGEEVLAFGHPYLGLGPVSLPMAKAEVVTVVSSRLSSFKLSNVGEIVGAFDEDRLAGLRGRVGAVARTTPLRVSVQHPVEGTEIFEMVVADLQPTRPMLVAVSVLQSIDSATRSSGSGGLDLQARFDLRDHDDLEIRQSFDGSSAVIDAAIHLLQVVAYLELNDLVDVVLDGIEVDVQQTDDIRTVSIEEVFADRRQARPGDTVELHLRLRGHRGTLRSETVAVTLDEDLDPGPFYLFVGDGPSIDAARQRIAPHNSRTFEDALDRLRSFRSARELVILGVDVDAGVVSDAGALPALPASVRELWKTASAGQTKGVSLAIVSEQVSERPEPLSGVARIDLEILPARR